MLAVRSMRRLVESSEVTDMCDRILREVESSSELLSPTKLATGETGTLDRLLG